MRQVESETAASELKLGNTTGRLLQLDREVGLLQQNNLEVNRRVETANRTTDRARLDAAEAQQVALTHTHGLLTITSQTRLVRILGRSRKVLPPSSQ